MSNWYYKQFYNLKELFSNNFLNILEQTKNYFVLLDNINADDSIKISSLISLIYGELLTNPSENIYTRYIKNDNNGNEIKIERYNNELAKKLYQSFLPLWQQKQLYNASMNWENLNKLLQNSKTRTLKNENLGNRNSEATSKSDSNSQSAIVKPGQVQIKIGDIAPEYVDTGTRGKSDNSATGNSKLDYKDNQNLTETIEDNEIKLKYISELNNIIDKNKFSLTNAYYEFLNTIIIPNQNIEFNPFPWPWRFGADFQ